MKMPKGFSKWSLTEQELWLVNRLQEYYAVESQIVKMLAKIRGGHKIEVKEIDRPDEALLKS
jgi:hypothetical protein